MKQGLLLLIISGCFLQACSQQESTNAETSSATSSNTTSPRTIGAIDLPEGCQRVNQSPGTFGAWLRQVPLKANNTVYLYNGKPKANQTVQFAVLDIPVGDKDLQQCADAIMRLYGEYLYESGRYQDIHFNATDGSPMNYSSWIAGYRFYEQGNKLKKRLAASPCKGRNCFDQYMQTVFAYAGTLSLSQELGTLRNINDISPGDVFIKGGSPGHAVLVTDVAYEKATGKKYFLLAQSYMPAQDIHVLRNPASAKLTPWYSTSFSDKLYTPEWIFKKEELKRFR